MSNIFLRMRPPMGSQKHSKYPELAGENIFLSLLLATSTDDGEPNDGELCFCEGLEINWGKLRMLRCGCYGCAKVKKCIKTQFSIYNR